MNFDASRAKALDKLNQFVEKNLSDYSKLRNFDFGPDKRDNVSCLSPYITHGVLNEIEIIKKSLEKFSFSKNEKFIQEVLWRTYWKGWLELRPNVWSDYLIDLRNIKEKYKHDKNYQNAIEGKTNIDCFNEWVNELKNNNYLHNHTRMWFASIWIHTLRLPWQLGADIFLKHLIDGDPASNTLSWRWVAGLHTKGKSYLAYPDNIKKFTNGKFYPSKQLATHVKSAKEEDKPLPKQLNFDSKIRSGKKGFLVHESDLSPNFLNEYDMVLIQGSPLKSIKRSSLVQSFISDALKEYQKECTENQKCDVALINLEDTKMIKKLMDEKGLSSLSSYYPALGAVNDQIQKLRNEGILVDYQYQKWDKSFWPHSSKGFFKLKSKIPKILEQLNCM